MQFKFIFVVPIFVLGLFVFLSVCSAAPNNMVSATVPIVGLSQNGKSFKTFGSGFVYQWKRRIVTTATVIDAVSAKYLIPENRLGVLTANSGKQMSESSQFHQVKVTCIDRKANIALLEADSDLNIKPVNKVRKRLLSAGQFLSVTGFTGSGLVQTYFEGVVSFATGTSEGNLFYGLAFPVGIGSTGGPAFDRKTGELLGIVQLKSRFVAREIYAGQGAIGESLGSAIVIPVKTLLEVLEKQK